MEHIQEYIQDLHNTLDQLPGSNIEQFINILFEARIHDRQVFAMGNGGSATTASHFIGDLGKNTRIEGLPRFRTIGLVDNIASITAYANDEGYENIFAEQLAGFVREYDVVLGVSTSGNSKNVIKAFELANSVGATTVALTGFDGGRLASLAKLNIHVPSFRIEQVEDMHLMIEHMVISALKKATMEYLIPEEVSSIPGFLRLDIKDQ